MSEPSKASLWQTHQRWLDGIAGDEEMAMLAEAVVRDPDLADDLARQARLDAALARCRQLAAAAKPTPGRPRWARVLPWAAILVAGLSTLGWWMLTPPAAAQQPMAMTLGGGSVLTIADGAVLKTEPGAQVHILPDGTIAVAAGAIEVEGDGTLPKAPITTPEAVVQRLGTHLLLHTAGGRTTLDVVHGSARMSRRSDGRQVIVGAGQRADSLNLTLGAALRTVWRWDPAAEAPGRLLLGRLVRSSAGFVVRAEPYRGGRGAADRVIMQQELRGDGGSAPELAVSDVCEVVLASDTPMRGNIILVAEGSTAGRGAEPLIHSVQIVSGINRCTIRVADLAIRGVEPVGSPPGPMPLRSVIIEGFAAAAQFDLIGLRLARTPSPPE
ncbi:MAG TPA: hypothetical protein DCS97_14390 [Planctomycetes bacterium]|nr:hypothetical protein [Planctomycetota bacterium]